MLKFEGLKVGQVIKAFDFKPMEGCFDRFVQGTIVEIMFHQMVKCYKIISEQDWFEDRIGQEVFVPMEVTFLEYDNRITLVGE